MKKNIGFMKKENGALILRSPKKRLELKSKGGCISTAGIPGESTLKRNMKN